MHQFPDGWRPRPAEVEFPDETSVAQPRRRFTGHPAVDRVEADAARTERFERKRATSSRPVGVAARARERPDEGRPVSWADGLQLLRERFAEEAA